MQTALQKAIAAPAAGSMKLAENRALAVQVVLRTPKMFWIVKPTIIRNVPVTAIRPTPRLAEWRYLFAVKGAPQWKGSKGVGTLKQDSRSHKHKKGDMVLAVQAKAQEVLKSLAKELTKPKADTYDATTGRYKTYVRYRVHTPDELKSLAGITA